MTSPGGPGARPGELFMEKAGGQAQQPLSRLRCGGIKTPAGPVGPPGPGGRTWGQEGWRKLPTGGAGGLLGASPGGRAGVPGLLLPGVQPHLSTLALGEPRVPAAPHHGGGRGSPIRISETRLAQKRQAGDFTGSACVHMRVCAHVRGWCVRLYQWGRLAPWFLGC